MEIKSHEYTHIGITIYKRQVVAIERRLCITSDNTAYTLRASPSPFRTFCYRKTSYMRGTLSEIMLRQVTIHLYPIIISNLIGAKK
jgi:hypothetical protein